MRRRGQLPFRSSFRVTVCSTAFRRRLPVKVNVGRYIHPLPKSRPVMQQIMHLYCVVPTDWWMADDGVIVVCTVLQYNTPSLEVSKFCSNSIYYM
jgi:hypothetical protein